MVSIQPRSETETKTYMVHRFHVDVDGLELFKSVSLRVELYDENDNLQAIRHITLSDGEYLAWNNDDSYIVNKVAEKLGFVLAQ